MGPLAEGSRGRPPPAARRAPPAARRPVPGDPTGDPAGGAV